MMLKASVNGAVGNAIPGKSRAGLKTVVFAVLFLSAMTFALPRETFDPHPGVGADVFCKSLYSFGQESQDAESLFDVRPVILMQVSGYSDTLFTPSARWTDPTRAPPL
ncbi:MAG: hypothetical protein KBA15_07965 [Spirochaetes bacterium]|jgi:hypothetical protein|nr:hypothetical protein [Spirochaetota bacterium]